MWRKSEQLEYVWSVLIYDRSKTDNVYGGGVWHKIWQGERQVFPRGRQIVQCVPLITEPSISLIIVIVKILQQNLNRSTFVM